MHREHLRTLHGGVSLTMMSVRSNHWVPHLRKLAKQTIRACHSCKRFQTVAAANPPPGNLPAERTQGTHPCMVIGVDYAGPIKINTRNVEEQKVRHTLSYMHVPCVVHCIWTWCPHWKPESSLWVSRGWLPERDVRKSYTPIMDLHLWEQHDGWSYVWREL